MKSFIILLLSCSLVLGGDTGICVITTAKTHTETASISTKEIFTRDGQTNLVRNTKTKAGMVQIRIHRFYHNGQLIGDFVAMPDSSGCTTEANTPYSVSFEFGRSLEVKSAVIGTKDGVVVDAFTCTNGLFSPMEYSIITKANSFGSDMRQLLSPEHVGKIPPGDFGEEVKLIIEKHKDK